MKEQPSAVSTVTGKLLMKSTEPPVFKHALDAFYNDRYRDGWA